jgi:rod shape determining protein RodA
MKILNFDKFLTIVVILIMVLGLVNLYSASFYSDKSAFVKQIIWVLIGVGLGVLLFYINVDDLLNASLFIYIVLFILTALTLFVGKEIRGTKSWLSIMGMGIQPSEFLKFGILLLVVKFLTNEGVDLNKFSTFVVVGLIFFLPLGILLLQPDVGMSISYIFIFLLFAILAGLNRDLLLIILLLMFSFGFFPFLRAYIDYLQKTGVEIGKLTMVIISKEFTIALAISSIVVGVLSLIISRALKDKVRFVFAIIVIFIFTGSFFGNLAYDKLKQYQKNRLMVFFNPQVDRLGAGYNVIQSEIAVGSGGFSGKGFLNGSQNKLNILPERTTDFAFSVLAEEWGFAGTIILLILYILLFYRLITLMVSSEDLKSYLMMSIITLIIFVNFLINMFMVLGLAPVTGLPLPFFSYGGSSMITNLSLIGLANNVYKRRSMML